MSIKDQEKSTHPIVMKAMQAMFDRYSENMDIGWEDYFYMHKAFSWVHEQTLKLSEENQDG